MIKNLAIKGHPTRGKEVIELLKMMGGKNPCGYNGEKELVNFFIDINNNIIYGSILFNDNYIYFTLEEFFEKYPYKLNELVLCDDGLLGVITKMEWDCEESDMKYQVYFNTLDYNKWYSSKNIICKFMAAKNKKLAIKGHGTRGKEIIELLEMLGGKNTYGYNGDMESLYFSIYNDTIIYGSDRSFLNDNYVFFTLEEFLEKYPFKFGDFVRIPEYESEVRILKMKWCEFGYVEYLVYRNDDEEWYTADELLEYNDNPNKTKPLFKHGDVVKLKGCPDKNIFWIVMDVVKDGYIFNDGIKYSFDDQHHYEKTNREVINTQPYIAPPYITAKVADKNNCDIECPCGYEFYDENGKLIGTKVLMRPKKSKYPTTYVECKEILGENVYYGFYMFRDLLNLIICRDAYYKIYGEEMGLGKPWEPAIQDNIWGITRSKGEIEKYSCHYGKTNLLEFPTEEMRDTFFENFKDLIEQCKEFL